MKTKTIELLGSKISVVMRSKDGRDIIDEAGECFGLFPLPLLVNETKNKLRRSMPVKIEKCWVVNPNYKRDGMIELEQWNLSRENHYSNVHYEIPPAGISPSGEYLPPEASGLPMVQNSDVAIFTDSSLLNPGIPETLVPGAFVFKAIFKRGSFIFLRDVTKIELPLHHNWHVSDDALERMSLSSKKWQSNQPPITGYPCPKCGKKVQWLVPQLTIHMDTMIPECE